MAAPLPAGFTFQNVTVLFDAEKNEIWFENEVCRDHSPARRQPLPSFI